jgi:hypothetical protein
MSIFDLVDGYVPAVTEVKGWWSSSECYLTG